jgi:hypothetical protein
MINSNAWIATFALAVIASTVSYAGISKPDKGHGHSIAGYWVDNKNESEVFIRSNGVFFDLHGSDKTSHYNTGCVIIDEEQTTLKCTGHGKHRDGPYYLYESTLTITNAGNLQEKWIATVPGGQLIEGSSLYQRAPVR